MKSAGVFEKDFVLYKAAANLVGRVLVGKLALPGAVVELSTESPFLGPAFGAARTIGWRSTLRADSRGEFQASGLPAGKTAIEARLTGYRQEEPAPLVVALRPGDNWADVLMKGTVSLSFRVVNRLGKGIPEAQALADAAPTAGVWAFADERGRLTLELPPDVKRFDCRIMAVGYAIKTVEMSSASPPKEVVLDDAPVLRGRVISESGESLAGAEVSISSVQAARQAAEHSVPVAAVTTDSAGRFRAVVMTGADLELSVFRKGYLPAEIRVAKVEEQTEVLAVLKEPEAALHGFAVDPRGHPIRDFTISIMQASLDRSRDSYPLLQNAESRDIGSRGRFQTADGSFSFPELPAGRFRIIGTALTGKMVFLPGDNTERPEVLRAEQEIELQRGVDSELILRLAPYVRQD
jgi:hypothetical protein